MHGPADLVERHHRHRRRVVSVHRTGAGIAAGPLTVSAAFAGDSYFAAASGSVGPLTVATGSSTLTLSSSLPGGSTAGCR